MKHLIAALIVLAITAGTCCADYLTIADGDYEDYMEFSMYIRQRDPAFEYTHDVTGVLAEGEILTASLEVTFWDDWWDPWYEFLLRERVRVDPEGPGNAQTVSWWWLDTLVETEIDVALLADGLLDVNVRPLRGDFYISDSTLSGTYGGSNYSGRNDVVPEPATLALFAMGGIATAAARLHKKK